MTRRTKLGLMSAAGLLMLVSGLFLTVSPTVGATPPDQGGEHKVTLCHRTNSVTNPYVILTVDYAAGDAALGHGNGDHRIHAGGVFDFAADPDVAYPTPRNGDQWGDIIPPYADHPGLNWTEQGQAVFEAGCGRPTTATTSDTVPPVTVTVPTTETPTTATPTTDTVPTETTPATAPTTVVPVTVPPPTVLPDEVTTTEVVVPDTEPEVLPEVVVRPERLPRTGTGTSWMALLGVALVLSGTGLIGASRLAVARTS